jgi:hypothetical protein
MERYRANCASTAFEANFDDDEVDDFSPDAFELPGDFSDVAAAFLGIAPDFFTAVDLLLAVAIIAPS